MTRSLVISLAIGLGVGAAYGVLRVRSPAPPIVALVGLLGMLVGEQAVATVRAHFLPSPASAAAARPIGEAPPEARS